MSAFACVCARICMRICILLFFLRDFLFALLFIRSFSNQMRIVLLSTNIILWMHYLLRPYFFPVHFISSPFIIWITVHCKYVLMLFSVCHCRKRAKKKRVLFAIDKCGTWYNRLPSQMHAAKREQIAAQPQSVNKFYLIPALD